MNRCCRKSQILLFCFAILLVAGCDYHTQDSDWPDPPATEATDVDIDILTDVDVEPDASIEPLAVEQFLERWTEAQNRQNLDAYGELYSPSFRANLSAHDEVADYLLDRDDWIQTQRDHRFRRSMQVTIEDLEIHIEDEVVQLSFTEVVTRGTERFEGPHEMVLALEDGELRVLHEYAFERFESPVDEEAKAPSAAQLATVITEGYGDNQASYIVLEPNADPDWFDADIEYKGYEAARAPVVSDRVPEEFVSWQGESVHLFDTGGELCEATVVGVYGLVRAVPHFGQIYQWQGHPRMYGDDVAYEEAADKEVIADGVWQLSHQPHLVAKVDFLEDGDCRSQRPVWARSAEADARPLRPVELESDEEIELLDAFRQLEAYQTVQENYREWFGEESSGDSEGTWSTYGGASPKLAAYRSEETGRTFAMVWADVGAGCGDFWGSHSELFELSVDDQGLRAVQWGSFSDAIRPLAMVDTDGEGLPHVFAESLFPESDDSILSPHHGAHQLVQRLNIPIHDCLC